MPLGNFAYSLRLGYSWAVFRSSAPVTAAGFYDREQALHLVLEAFAALYRLAEQGVLARAAVAQAMSELAITPDKTDPMSVDFPTPG